MVWNAETPQPCDVKKQSDLEGGREGEEGEGGFGPPALSFYETLSSTSC